MNAGTVPTVVEKLTVPVHWESTRVSAPSSNESKNSAVQVEAAGTKVPVPANPPVAGLEPGVMLIVPVISLLVNGCTMSAKVGNAEFVSWILASEAQVSILTAVRSPEIRLTFAPTRYGVVTGFWAKN